MVTSSKLASAGFLFAVLATPVVAQVQVAYVFNLPAQALSDSLSQLGNQTRINVIFEPGAVTGRKAPALRGRYELKQALTKLLGGTGLTARFTDATTVVIKSTAHSSPSSSGAGKSQDSTLLLPTVVVTGHAQDLTATRANTPLKDIPQSVSVISRETLDQQNATDVASALQYATGFTLVQDSSQDTYIYSRGFLVNTIHIDGGAPTRVNLGGVGVTSLDLSEYDGLEVLRGSDSLFGGMGNPSATVSLQRKEPTATPQAQFEASIGSWSQRRLVGDVSGPLTASGTLSGRLVVSADDQDYFYNIASQRNRKIYGILKYDMGPSTTLEVGGSYQKESGVNNFAGLPRYDDGADPHLSRSLALTAPWATERNTFTELFAKLDHHFNDSWRLKVDATQVYQRTPEDTSAGYEGPIGSATGLLTTPLTANTGSGYDNQQMLDATVTGSFDWLGQKQQVMFGADYQHEVTPSAQLIPNPSSGAVIDPFAFDPALYPAPDLSPGNILAAVNANFKIIQSGIYGAFRFHPTENLALLVGGRLSDYRSNQEIDVSVYGQAFPPSINNYKDSNKFTPYVGITYALSPHYTLYGSYADIYFTSGGDQTKDHTQLAPANGVNMEAGIKGAWFDNTVNGSLALFKIDQSGIGALDPSVPPSYNCCFISSTIKSKGFEAELSGPITPNWQVTAGYTYDIHQTTNAYFVSALPRNLFKLWTNYHLPAAWRRWSVGGGLLAQTTNRVAECTGYADDSSCSQFARFRQGSYVIAALRAEYLFNDHWSASLNLNNIFDRTYYQTLGQLELGNWYGAPRNFMFKVVGKF